MANESNDLTALIVTDMQYDICDGGPLANINSLAIVPKINNLRENYDFVIFTIKSHPEKHSSFKQYGGTYVKHCIEGTHGGELHNDLIVSEKDFIIKRGTQFSYNSDSGFYDDEASKKTTRLGYYLQVNNVKNLYFCGNNMDTCIFSTVLDALNNKFNCHLITNAIGYVSEEKYNNKIKFLESLGITLINNY